MKLQMKDSTKYLQTASRKDKSKKKQAKKKSVPPEAKSANLASSITVSKKSDGERVYDFLTEYGASTPYRIARALNMDRSLVRKILRELQKQGKINLNLS